MMCEHEFESLRTADGSFCMTACRKCMKSTGEIETLAKAEQRIAAALLEDNRRMREALTEIANHNPETKREALWSVELAKMALKGGA